MVLEGELGSAALLFGIWLAGKLMALLRSSPLLGQIAAGVLLGPPLANIVPHQKAWRLWGKLGVMLFVVDSGMGLTFAELQAVGPRAFFAATAGVLAPVGLAIAFLAVAYPSDFTVKSALAAGAAIAPTSLGFSAQLMSEAGMLRTELGQLVAVAAVFDDVLSLLLLAEVQALTDESSDRSLVVQLLLPVLGSLGSIAVGILLCMEFAVPRIVEKVIVARLEGFRRNQALLFALISLAVAYAYACALVGSSELLGCFLAGLAFSGVDGIAELWKAQLRRIVQWGVRLFFACTIAFGLPPVEKLFAAESVLCGLGLFACQY